MSCLQNKSEDIPTCEIEVIYELECQIKVPLHHLLCNFTPTSTKQVTGKMNQRNETAHLKEECLHDSVCSQLQAPASKEVNTS